MYYIVYGIYVLYIYTPYIYKVHITSTHDIYMYIAHNTTYYTVHCTCYIKHMKDEYKHIIHYTYGLRAILLASSVMYFVYVCTIYFSRLALLVTNIAQRVILYNLQDLLRTGLSCLKMAQACNSN